MSTTSEQDRFPPYKGLAPFEDAELDVLLFFGRDRERELIVANLMASRLTVLYGESGVGKSSVLRAGVAHHLRRLARDNVRERGEPELAVVVFDAWRDDPVRALADAVDDAVTAALGRPAPARPNGGGALGERLANSTALLDGDLYIILDQLEEYFLYHGADAGPESVTTELAEAVGRPDVRASFLLSIREDALAKLDVFKAGIPNLFGNYLRLDHLDRRAARVAILGPVEAVNQLAAGDPVTVEEELVDAVLDEVTAGRVDFGQSGRGAVERAPTVARIEAPYLQLVMQRLWDEELASGSHTLRLETLRRLGGAAVVVRQHLERALEALTPTEKDVAAAVLDHLVTPSGMKVAHEARDLAGYARRPDSELQPVLTKLANERILRASSNARGGSRYEIFHDVLAEPVLTWKSTHEAERELKRQHEQAERRQRRLLALAGAAIVALLVVAGVAIFALTQRSEARAQARASHSRELAAAAAAQLQSDPELALLLALEAARVKPTPQVEDALRAALLESRLRAVLRHAGPVTTVSFSRRGGLVLTGSGDGTARIWKTDGSGPLHVLAQRGAVTSATFSPDGRLVLTAGRDGTARLWRTRTGQLLTTRRVDSAVNDAAFSSDGRLFVTAAGGGTAQIWRVPDAKLLRTLRHPGPVRHVAFSRTGTLLVTVGNNPDSTNHRARIFDVGSGRLLHELPATGVSSAAFSPDSKLLVTGGIDHLARIFNVRTGKQLHLLAGHRQAVTDALFGPAGNVVVTTSIDGTARIWNARTGNPITILLHTNAVESAAFSADGKWLITASADNTARIWDTETGRLVTTLRGHADTVGRAAFSLDGRTVATASQDGTARLWDPGTEPELRVLSKAGGPVPTASFSRDGQLLTSASLDGTARIWRVGVPSLPVKLTGGPFLDIRFSADATRLVTASSDRTARIWRTSDGQLLRTLEHSLPVTSASFSPDGELVLSTSGSATRVWRAHDGALVRTLHHPAAVCCAAFSPRGDRLVTGSADGIARVWDTQTGMLRSTLRGHRGELVRVSFSPDGKTVLTAGGDKTAGIWDAETGALLHLLRGHRQALTDAQFSADGTRVVSASRDHDARTWNVATGKPEKLLRAHFGPVFGASFSDDGRWILTVGPITAGLWQAETGQLVLFLDGPQAPLTTASFAPDGDRLAAASRDGTTRIYNCEICGRLGDLRAVARARLTRIGRTLSAAERQRYVPADGDATEAG